MAAPSPDAFANAAQRQVISSILARLSAAEQEVLVLQGSIITPGGGSGSGGTTGSGGSTGNPTTFSEPFGTAGATWGTNWAASPAGCGTVASNIGTITPAGSAYSVADEFCTGMTAQTDTQIDGTFGPFASGLPEMYQHFAIRSDGSVNSVGPADAYYFVASPNANQILIRRAVAGVVYTLDTVAFTFTAGVTYKYKFISYSNGLQLSVAAVGSSYGAPISQGIDPTPLTTAGKVRCYVVNGGTTTARAAAYGAITVSTPPVTTITGTYTPSAGTSGGGTVSGGTTTGGGASNASGIQMPPTAPAGWSRIVSDDFVLTCAEGQFYNVYGRGPGGAGTWSAYGSSGDGTSGWMDTQHLGLYDEQYLSVPAASSYLNMRLLTVSGVPRVQAPIPRWNNDWGKQTYGRYSVCFRADSGLAGYKTAWLLWPGDSNWNEGEVDFPEGDLNGTINAYNHQPGSPATNAFAKSTSVRYDDAWHVATTEWKPSGVSFYLDGVFLGTAPASSTPTTPMYWALQTETSGTPGSSTTGNVKVDWVTVDSYVSG